MEYTFGVRGISEVLRIKGSTHTELQGYRQVEHIYPDQTITDHFRVTRKLDSKEDADGNCYDWYEIDRRYRVVDKTGPIVAKVEENAAVAEDAICELSIALDQRLGELEDAACELAMMIARGE